MKAHDLGLLFFTTATSRAAVLAEERGIMTQWSTALNCQSLVTSLKNGQRNVLESLGRCVKLLTPLPEDP
jgi:hypothetical protein